MRFLVTEKLGPHKFKTPEGYLICTDAILSRTGKQEYKRCELFGDACEDPDKIVNVDRTDAEVFDDKAMASFENKPICIEHPDEDVNVENHNDLSVGFVRDIHKGEDNGRPVMMGTLVITDKNAVEAVENGEYKELSCGYDCDIDDDNEPCQRNIRGNHVALCEHGRAGIARIVDSTNDDLYGLIKEPVKRYYLANKYDKKWDIEDDIVIIAKNISEAEQKLKYRFPDAYNLREISHSDYLKFKRGNIVIDSMEDSEMKDTDFSKQTKQGYQVLEMYRDGGRLHIIFKRANDYGIGLGYDTIDGQWSQGRYNFSTLEKARQALMEEKPYARRIQDSVNDDDWSNVEEENYKKANEEPLKKDKQLVRSSSGEIHVFKARGKYEVDAYNRNNLDYNALRQIENKFNVNLRRGDYGYITIISANKDAIYKAFAAINPAYGVGSWRIEDSVAKDSKEQLFTIEYKQGGTTYIRKVRANSIEDAISKVKDDAYKVVVFTNQVLSEMGKNNSIGKYDRVVQAMRSLYSESLLPDDKLKELIRKKVPEYIKKYVKE